MSVINFSSFTMEPPYKKRRTYIKDDRPSIGLPNEIVDLIFSQVPIKSLLIIRTLSEYAKDWCDRRIEQILRKRFGLNYSGDLLSGNLRIDFLRLFIDQIWKIEVLLDRIQEYEIDQNISINNEVHQKDIADGIGDILQKIPQSYMQWCYSMTHWRERRHAISLKELDLEAVLNRTVFIDCYKSWKYIDRSISASDGWIKMIMFGTDSSGKMATIYYHYSVTRREDIIGSKDFRVKFMCHVELGFINDKDNSNNIIIAPLEYFERNTGDMMYDIDDLNELYEQGKIEETVHENYVPCDMSFHVSKDDRDMRMLMDWIGYSKEISTRQFYQFLQSIMVKYRLSNHEKRWSINYPSDLEREEEIKKYSAIYDKIVNLHLYREKLLFDIELKSAILGNKLFKDITNERKNELDLLIQRCNIRASLVARSNPRSKQTKTMYKYIRLSIVPFESNEPIILTARMAIEWKNGKIRLTLTIYSVPNGWNEPNETDWNNLSITTNCYNSDQTFILEDFRQSVIIFHEAVNWSNSTEQLRDSSSARKKQLNLINCKYLTGADLRDMFIIALFGLQTSLVQVISSSDPANSRSYQLDLRMLAEQFLTAWDSPPSWPVEMVRKRTQSDYDCDGAFERGDCSLESSDEDEEYYYKEISTTQQTTEQQSRWCNVQ